MKKTLLLCFIHGFKGGDDTFGKNYSFVEHLRKRLATSLPRVNVEAIVYPKYETRGDLGECASRFRDWLINKVIDLEVAAGTTSPTVDPSVRVVLVGHSMGGIVAAETTISIASEHPIHNSVDEDSPNKSGTATPPAPNPFMFPYIQGLLAFDTPFLGISPGVVAHNAESHYATAVTAISQLSSLAGLWAGGKASQSFSSGSSKALVPKENKEKSGGSGWGKWGTIAMAAGAISAVAAGGVAAYYNKEHISHGLNWVTSHLEFVGCLARKEELRRRVAYMLRLNRELGVGFGNFYTRLGQAASSKQVSMVGTVLGNERTFCIVPRQELVGDWREAVNDKAKDEIWAHMSMFEPEDNPNFDKLAAEASAMVASWVPDDWYDAGSTNDTPQSEGDREQPPLLALPPA